MHFINELNFELNAVQFAIENKEILPVMQIASFGGLSAINFFLALWMQIISDFLILRHRINKETSIPVVSEESPLIQQPQFSDDNIKVYKEDLTKNYYLRIAMIIAILSCFVIGRQRLNNIENNINHIAYRDNAYLELTSKIYIIICVCSIYYNYYN